MDHEEHDSFVARAALRNTQPVFTGFPPVQVFGARRMATLACDYYTEVGVRDELVTVGKAGSGSVEAALFGSTFDPKTLLRIPRENRPGDAGGLCNGLAMFTFPHGVRLVTHEEAMANAIPVVTSFVLTAEDKSRMYCACIVWYEVHRLG